MSERFEAPARPPALLLAKPPALPWPVLMLILCWCFASGEAYAQTTHTLLISSAPECTDCHLVWLDDFARPREEILVPYQRDEGWQSGREGAESTDLMCYSCHDGYVADFRARTRTGRQHPMAGISKLGRRKPPRLPLLREEEVYCGTCHTPHGPGHELPSLPPATVSAPPAAAQPSSSPETAKIPIPYNPAMMPMLRARGLAPAPPVAQDVKTTPTAPVKAGQMPAPRIDLENNGFLRLASRPGPITLCTQCHEYTTSTVVGNHPLDHEEFALPAQLARAHAQPLTPKGGIGCETCHNPHGATNPFLVILDGEGDTSPGLCLVCHQSDYTRTGLGRYSHPIGVVPKLNTPKPTFPNGELIPLTVSGKINCLSCHDVHDSRSPLHLLRQTSADGSLCITCHPGVADTLPGTGHDLRVSAPQSKNMIGETPDQSGMCSVCHIPHKSPYPFLWARATRTGGHVLDRLCLSCHVPGGAAKTYLRGPMTHETEINKSLIQFGPETKDPSLTDIPIYDDEGRPAQKGWITCMTCHDPHKWQAEGPPPKEYPPPGEGNALNSFLRTRSQNQICKHCHGVRSLWRYKYFHSRLRYEE